MAAREEYRSSFVHFDLSENSAHDIRPVTIRDSKLRGCISRFTLALRQAQWLLDAGYALFIAHMPRSGRPIKGQKCGCKGELPPGFRALPGRHGAAPAATVRVFFSAPTLTSACTCLTIAL